MPTIIDANVSPRSQTGTSEPELSLPEPLAQHLEKQKLGVLCGPPSGTFTVTSVPSVHLYSESSAFSEFAFTTPEHPDLRNAFTEAWKALHNMQGVHTRAVLRTTRATNPTSTTVSSAARFLRDHQRDERLRRMSPERRANYERIRKLRNDIGPIDFDVVKALRELRDDE
jgi:hypothetical protein